MSTDIENRVYKVVGSQFGVELASMTLEQSIVEDLGADSIDVVELVIALEHEFKIAIETDEQNLAKTVRLIIELVDSKLSDKIIKNRTSTE
jgi:acyl carrier protein